MTVEDFAWAAKTGDLNNVRRAVEELGFQVNLVEEGANGRSPMVLYLLPRLLLVVLEEEELCRSSPPTLVDATMLQATTDTYADLLAAVDVDVGDLATPALGRRLWPGRGDAVPALEACRYQRQGPLRHHAALGRCLRGTRGGRQVLGQEPRRQDRQGPRWSHGQGGRREGVDPQRPLYVRALILPARGMPYGGGMEHALADGLRHTTTETFPLTGRIDRMPDAVGWLYH